MICNWCKYNYNSADFYRDFMINGVWMYGGKICEDCFKELAD